MVFKVFLFLKNQSIKLAMVDMPRRPLSYLVERLSSEYIFFIRVLSCILKLFFFCISYSLADYFRSLKAFDKLETENLLLLLPNA